MTYENLSDIYEDVVGTMTIEVQRGVDTQKIWLPKVQISPDISTQKELFHTHTDVISVWNDAYSDSTIMYQETN